MVRLVQFCNKVDDIMTTYKLLFDRKKKQWQQLPITMFLQLRKKEPVPTTTTDTPSETVEEVPQEMAPPSEETSRIELGDVTPHNIKQLKRLNQVIFPVSYNDKFYKDVLEVGELAKLGTKMLNHVLNICEKEGTFDNIYLHVQISNESAIDFYRKFGFEIIETKKNYYKRIEPADAHVLQKNLKSSSPGQSPIVQKAD
ncbi:NAA50 acetyltransferase, partial [Polypterus senegalus]